jgi:hypothetical protein
MNVRPGISGHSYQLACCRHVSPLDSSEAAHKRVLRHTSTRAASSLRVVAIAAGFA